MLSEIRTTEWMLEQWGRWAFHKRGLSLTYPSIEPYTRMRGSSVPEPMISDDEGCTVDRLVSDLLKSYPLEGEAVARYYLEPGSYRRLSREMGLDRRQVSALLKGGTMWIDGQIKGVAVVDNCR